MPLHGRQRGRNKPLDGTIIRNEAEEKINEIQKLDDFGKKFEADKVRIENMLDQIEASDLESKERERQKRMLQQERERLKQKYESEIVEKQDELIEETKGDIEGLEEVANKLQEQENAIREIKSESGAMDTAAAADATAARKAEVQEHAREEAQKLQMRIEQKNIQMRNMRNNRLSGRS